MIKTLALAVAAIGMLVAQGTPNPPAFVNLFSDFYDVALFQEPIPVQSIPVVENQTYRKQLIQFYSGRKQSWKAKLPYSLRRVLRKIKYGLPTTHTMEKKI